MKGRRDMSEPEYTRNLDETRLADALQRLESRISRLESYLGLSSGEESGSGTTLAPGGTDQILSRSPDDDSGLEMRIGEFGLAWVGSIIFSLGIIFLVTYIHNLGYGISATALGYVSAAALFILSHRWSDSFTLLSRITTASSLVLLYYTTVRLHFFSSDPLVTSRPIAVSLLLLVVGLLFYLSIRRASQGLAGLAILLSMVSAVLIDQTHLSLPLVALNAVISSILAIKRDWRRLLVGTIITAYGVHLLWLLNNFVLGHPLKGVENHQFNLIYLFLYVLAFAAATLLIKDTSGDLYAVVGIILLNCIAFSAVSLLVVLTQYQTVYASVYLGVFLVFMAISIIHWLRTKRQILAAGYACFGYMGLTIAIYGYADPPTSFLWLSLQSLLVVSMALWFRSRVLVVVNTMIFIGIVAAYMITSPSSHLVNFTFVIVAHASARVMNWQKERLTLQTEMMRNIYLLTAFLLILMAVYRVAPAQYVTLFWTAAAAVYFVLSSLLKNIKYRWIAIGMILVSVMHLFVVDLARLDASYRVMAFLGLGLMTLIISLFYTRFHHLPGGKKDSPPQ